MIKKYILRKIINKRRKWLKELGNKFDNKKNTDNN